MKKVIDSAMETMHVLGCSVEEIKDAVTTLMKIVEMPVITALPAEAQPEPVLEPAPLRAFPDSFYYRPVVAEEPRQMPFTNSLGVKGTSVISGSLGAPQWIPHRPKPEIAYPGQWCHCGHRWEEHMPCCVHLVEGCSCEEFIRVPMGSAEGA